MTLPDLIAALERAEGPSRELDAAIAAHSGWVRQYETQFWPPAIVEKMRKQKKSGYHFGGPEIVPAFSASLDAALTLVPEGWHAIIATRPDWPTVELFEFPLPCRSVPLLHAATPALALCAAALKARA